MSDENTDKFIERPHAGTTGKTACFVATVVTTTNGSFSMTTILESATDTIKVLD